MANIEQIENAELASSVREKLNALIAKANSLSDSEDFGLAAIEAFATELNSLSEQVSLIAAKNQLVEICSLSGDQNEDNCVFLSAEAFVLDTTKLYLNGQRMTPKTDYIEVNKNTIRFVSYIPKITDKLFMEAVHS